MAKPIIPYPNSAVNKTTLIYGICDPRSGELRYIGKTVLSLKARMHVHLSGARKSVGKTRCMYWLRSLMNSGITPDCFLIEAVPPLCDWQESESHWIAVFRALGANLTNLTNGGEGLCGAVFSEEHKRKISQSQIGKIVSKETRDLISLTGKGRVLTAETRKRMSSAAMGKKKGPMSDSHKEKLAALYRGKPGCVHTNESKKKISAAHKGRKYAGMPIEELRDTVRKMWADPEYRARNMAARQKRKLEATQAS